VPLDICLDDGKWLKRTLDPRVHIPLDYGIRVEQVTLPRAQDASRLLAIDTRSREFNVHDRLPPNTMAAAAVMMGRTPIASHFLPALSWKLGKGTRQFCHA